MTAKRKLKAESTKEITVVSDLGSLGCHLPSAVCHLVFIRHLSSVIRHLYYCSASEVGRSLGISRVNVGRCAERGKDVLDNYLDLKDIAK